MNVGIDFDNTLVCYDGLFYAAGMLAGDDVFFETTMEDKARRVAALGCTHAAS